MAAPRIRPFDPAQREAVLDLVLRAWEDIMPKTRTEVPGFVYDTFYPDGWQARQRADIAQLLDLAPEACWLIFQDGQPVGVLCLRLHPEDQMGEMHLLAVDPLHQRQGLGTALMEFAEQKLRAGGFAMLMVETLADSGHTPARLAYEGQGFKPWPVARYFKKL